MIVDVYVPYFFSVSRRLSESGIEWYRWRLNSSLVIDI